MRHDLLPPRYMLRKRNGSDVNTTKHAGQPTDTTPNDEKSTLPTPHRLTAAFRGRTVQGVRVDLPPGYSGLLLRAPGDVSSAPLQPPAPTKPVPAPKAKGKAAADKAKKAAAAAQAKARRAARRSGKREAPAVEVDEEEQEQPEEEAPVEPDQPAPELVEASSHAEPGPVENEEGQGEIRTLVPSATFSSFVLWNADVPVDAGKDEYLRTLTEWVGLAAEVSNVDFAQDMMLTAVPPVDNRCIGDSLTSDYPSLDFRNLW